MRPTFLLSLGLCSAMFACQYDVANEHRMTSMRLNLEEPTELQLGKPNQTVDPSSLRFSVEALDEQGLLMPVDSTVQAFVVSGGSRIPLSNPCSTTTSPGDDPPWLLSRFTLTGGRSASVTLPLTAPAIFGRVNLNVEDPVSQAMGATPPIYFPEATIPEIIKPIDVDAANASFCSPHLGRLVVFDHTAAASGTLIVSSLFQNAIAVTDTSSKEYSSVYVFTFSRPDSSLVRGRIIQRVSGAIAKFNGMTQVANPTVSGDDAIRNELVPAPIELDATRRPAQPVTAAANKWLTQYIAAPVRVTGIVCEAAKDKSRSDNWNKYNTVVINQTGDNNPESVNGCGGVNSATYVPPNWLSVQFPGHGTNGFDPGIYAGQEVTITGMLQNSASKSGKTLYWTVVVRDATDVCLKPRAMCENAQ